MIKNIHIVNESIKFGWQSYIRNFMFFTGLLCALLLFYSGQDYAISSLKNNIPVLAVLFLFIFSLNTAVSIGLNNISLFFTEDKKAGFQDMFEKQHVFFSFVGAWLIYTLIVVAGLLMLVVPGIVWSARFMFYKYFIIEKEMSPIESLKKSYEISGDYLKELILLEIFIVCFNVLCHNLFFF